MQHLKRFSPLSLRSLLILLSLLTIFLAFPIQPGVLAQSGDGATERQTIVQVSTYDYFAAGHLDGLMPLSELRRYGDFGLGTFEKIDGEMVVVDGQIYQVPITGVPRVADPTLKTPFAVVAFFEPKPPTALKPGLNLEALSQQIDLIAPNQNVFVLVRVEGKFTALKLRSVPPQDKPYPPLTEIIKQQTVFDLTNVEGVLVGVRSPALSKGLNVVGYHFHFVSQDRKAGGHVLELTTADAAVQINEKPVWRLFLPPQ